MSLKTIPQLSPSLWGIATDAMRLYETTKRLKPFRFKPSKLSCVDMIMNLGGERGIRTLDTRKRIHTFQACSLSHSDTSPRCAIVTKKKQTAKL